MYKPLEDLNRAVARAVMAGLVPFFVLIPLSREALDETRRDTLAQATSEEAAAAVYDAVMAYERDRSEDFSLVVEEGIRRAIEFGLGEAGDMEGTSFGEATDDMVRRFFEEGS